MANQLAEVLSALGDPLRLRVVTLLAAHGELNCGEIPLAIPRPTLSHHLNVLRAAGIVATVRRGNQRVNSLRAVELEALFPGLLASVVRAAGRPEPGARRRAVVRTRNSAG